MDDVRTVVALAATGGALLSWIVGRAFVAGRVSASIDRLKESVANFGRRMQDMETELRAMGREVAALRAIVDTTADLSRPHRTGPR